MKLGKPELLERNGQVRYTVPVASSDGTTGLWYSVDRAYGDMVSERADAALLALLIPAMARGEDIHVVGVVSERLLYNLAGPYQTVLQIMLPRLRRIKIIADAFEPATGRPTGVASGFSGGIDSFCILADYHYGDPLPGYRLTHLLYNNVGAHGKLSHILYPQQRERTRRMAERIGLPFIAVDSNLGEFYTGFTFQETHTPRNLSVPLLLQAGLRRFFYASGFNFANTAVKAAPDMAYSDAVTVSMLRTESLDALTAGSEYTRVEKTLRVAGVPDSYGALDVCVNTGNTVLGNGSIETINCSQCWKCLRTLLTLEIAGYLDRYAAVFDLDIYRRKREWYIAEVLISDYPLLREVVALAAARGYAFPRRSRLYAALQLPRAAQAAKPFIRRARRVVRRFLPPALNA